MTDPSDSNYSHPDGDTILSGPANWFSLTCPAELQVQQTESFLEFRALARDNADTNSEDPAKAPRWTMTLYAAWVDETEPETNIASFQAETLFPDVIRNSVMPPLHPERAGRAWAGVSRQKPHGPWWYRMFRRAVTYEWRLWIFEHEQIMVVASLQSRGGFALGSETVAACERTLNSVEFAKTLAWPPEIFRGEVVQLGRKYFPLLSIKATGSFGLQIEDSEINLANFYRSYLQQPNNFKQIVLPGLTTVVRLQEWGPDQLMPPLAEISDRVMPMLYPENEADTTLKDFVKMPWVCGLAVMFVLDEDNTYRFVHRKMLQSWQISEEGLHALAIDNLNTFARNNPLEVTVIGEDDDARMLVPVSPNAYNSVRLLGPELHGRLRKLLGAELVVGVPNRDFFVAVSLNHPDLVSDVQQRVIQDYQSMHHPLTSRLLVISADGVSEYCDS
ncbi:MAG: DUF1444 family protein [Fuerstiella sp.]|nr:DUF1444 family protein [Fuerstiella sp.]MCP4857816.1 DUF1444 family protein [Fuerstiella sp.]